MNKELPFIQIQCRLVSSSDDKGIPSQYLWRTKKRLKPSRRDKRKLRDFHIRCEIQLPLAALSATLALLSAPCIRSHLKHEEKKIQTVNTFLLMRSIKLL